MSIVKSESISKLVSALALAKAAFKPVLKLSENPGFKRNGKVSKYADLATAIDATEESLLANGLVVSQFPVNDGDRVGALTLLTHSSGEYLGEAFTLPLGQQTAQTGVAAVTYARRTGYLAALGIASEDDDGQTASEREDETTSYVDAYTHNSSTTEIPDFQDAQRGPAHSDYSAPRPTPAARPATAPPSTTKASRAENESASSTTLPEAAPFVTNAAGSPAPASVSPEHICIDGDHQKCTDSAVAAAHGDAYEGPDDNGSLPTEEELVAYRTKFKILGDDLSAKGKLKSSQGLPINRKLLVFLIGVTKAADAKQISKNQWDNFFERVDAATANPEVGLVGLATLVNKANGIEKK